MLILLHRYYNCVTHLKDNMLQTAILRRFSAFLFNGLPQKPVFPSCMPFTRHTPYLHITYTITCTLHIPYMHRATKKRCVGPVLVRHIVNNSQACQGEIPASLYASSSIENSSSSKSISSRSASSSVSADAVFVEADDDAGFAFLDTPF